MMSFLIDVQFGGSSSASEVRPELGGTVGRTGIVGGTEEEGGREVLQGLAGCCATGSVDEAKVVGAGCPFAVCADESGEARAGGEADEAELVRVKLPFGGAGANELDRAFGIRDTDVIVVARREAIGEHERCDTPVVVAFGDVHAFGAIHQHDVRTTGGDYDGASIALAFGRHKDGEERSVERAVALGQRDFARFPERDVVVRDELLASRVGATGGEGQRGGKQGGNEDLHRRTVSVLAWPCVNRVPRDRLKGMRALFFPIVAAIVCLPLRAEPRDVLTFVEKNCTACHNGSLRSGDLDLTALKSDKTFERDRETWEKVAEKLKLGQMPPPGVPHPQTDQTRSVTQWLEGEFARQDKLLKPQAGHVSARRLNRAEYNNTIRDLLGIDIRPADNFPVDTAAFGFDNISDALLLTPELLENYMDAAERSVRWALFGPPRMKPAATHYAAPVRLNDQRGRTSLPKDLFHYDETGLSLVHSAHFIHRFPVDAEYSFRLVLNGHRPNQSEPVHPALFIDGKLVQSFEVDATDLEGQIVECRTRVTAGEHLLSESYLKNYHGLPPSYNGPEPSKRPPMPLLSSTRGKLSEQDIETLRKYGTKIKTDSIETRVDNRFESLDVGGPFNQSTAASSESLRKVYVCGHAPGKHTDACTRVILTNFVGSAFRRPATAREVDEYAGYVKLARQHGDSFEEGIATALEAVLVSPKFIYRIERNVGPYELASRLSYFLWSSMPDAELLREARLGRLNQPAVLNSEAARMLRDPKAAALVENFAGQWLQFRNIDVVRPDLERFPQFDDGLRLAMRRETELFLEDVVRKDRSILDLLTAKDTFVNERLARFYGIPGVTGPEFRRVDVSKTARGGGILSQASVLTVSSYSTRTSPVLRGKWVLENLLNAPPPAPPPGVPPLDEAKAGQTASLRMQMEEHRKSPVCASCHSRMDPLGFGLENFNAIGAWRTEDGKFPVDATGTLPDGRKFNSPEELKQLLKQDRDVFARAVTEKLLTYALGRGLERYDRPTVAAIVAQLPAKDYRFSALVTGIVNSLPFQKKSGEPAE